jgi:hypothetical protein
MVGVEETKYNLLGTIVEVEGDIIEKIVDHKELTSGK